jgi:hypothetical protein
MRLGHVDQLCGYLLVGMAAIFVFISCSGTEEISFEPSPFVIDFELLAEPTEFPELGLLFRPPQGWTTVDSTTRDAFRKMQADTDLSREFYPIFSLEIFTDSPTGAIAYIARVERAQGSLEEINEKYDAFLSSRIDESSLRRNFYTINDLEICYYLHHTAQIINHKLLGRTSSGNTFLIEYVIPAFANPNLDAPVTSSMAALRPSNIRGSSADSNR